MLWDRTDIAGVFLWLEVQWCVFVGTIISNTFFIAIRTCVHHKIKMDFVDEIKQLPGTDTIIAISEVANMFNAQAIPTIVSIILFCQHNLTGRTHSPVFWLLFLILLSNLISLFMVTWVIFIDWKKGPEWWTRSISFKVFKSFLIFIYLSVPIINISGFVYMWTFSGIIVNDQPIGTYIVFYNVLCLHRIFDWFVFIKKDQVEYANFYMILKTYPPRVLKQMLL